jgi:CelD/BcsL family acetyltransferase involved in cellulose biosynthesis
MPSTLTEFNKPRSASTGKLSASVVRTSSELAQLREEWTLLFRESRCSNAFLSFSWLSRWWAHFGKNHKLFVVTIRDQSGHLIALAPLYISRALSTLRLRRLGLLGDGLVGSDYLDVLVAADSATLALQSLAAFIRTHESEWDYVDFADTKRDSYVSTVLREEFRKDDLVAAASDSSRCPFAVLPASPEEYFSSLGPKLRKHLKYYLRALQKLGRVDFVTVAEGPELQKAFDDLFQLHNARILQRKDVSAFALPELADFHRAAVVDLASNGLARIHLLQLDGRTIAAIYLLHAGQAAFLYQSGIDPEYARFSVGSLLIRFAVEEAIRSGIHEFDFLRGDEGYKAQWTNNVRQMQSLRFFDNRMGSSLAHAIHFLRGRARSWKQSLSSSEVPEKLRASVRVLFRPKSEKSASPEREAESV